LGSREDTDKIKHAIALLQSKGYTVTPAAGDVPFDGDAPSEFRVVSPLYERSNGHLSWCACESCKRLRAAVLAEGERWDDE